MKHQFHLTISLLALLFWVSSCTPDSNDNALENGEGNSEMVVEGEDVGPDGCIIVDKKQIIKFAHGQVELRPALGKYRGDLLVLPPWNQPRDAWCSRSDFCKTASNQGYRLIMADMGKSIYIDQVYPETREDWQSTLTYSWLLDSLIPHLQDRYCMLQEKGNNVVVGLSSGSRGVIKLMADRPELFTAGAALSGDYDPSELIGDNIYTGFLGTYEEHADRWEAADNVISYASLIKAPLYLGHGTEDPMIPFTQTRSLYDALVKANPSLNVKLNLASGQGESFSYWNTEVENLFAFFEDTQANRPETP